MLSMPDSSILRVAVFLLPQIRNSYVSALARNKEKAEKSNHFLMQTVPINCVVRCVVLYAKQFSRRKCGARNHGDSLLIRE